MNKSADASVVRAYEAALDDLARGLPMRELHPLAVREGTKRRRGFLVSVFRQLDGSQLQRIGHTAIFADLIGVSASEAKDFAAYWHEKGCIRIQGGYRRNPVGDACDTRRRDGRVACHHAPRRVP